MKKPKAPRLVIVAVFTTVTIVFWVFYNLYEVLTSTPPVKVPPEILAPVSPELDVKTLEKLESRTFFKKEDVDSAVIITAPSPTPTLTEAEESEKVEAGEGTSPSMEPSPTASPSANLES